MRTKQSHRIATDEADYALFMGGNPEYNTTTVRFNYQSMVTPSSVYDYDMNTRQRKLLKQQEVLGGYDARIVAAQHLLLLEELALTSVHVIVVHRARCNHRLIVEPHRCRVVFGITPHEKRIIGFIGCDPMRLLRSHIDHAQVIQPAFLFRNDKMISKSS